MHPSPISQSPLTEQDVRHVVRLLGEVIAATGDIDSKRRTLMDGLCKIVGADSWVWCMALYDPEKAPAYVGLLHGGFDDERFARFVEATHHPAGGAVARASALELKARGTHLTRTLQQLDPTSILQTSSAAPFWKKADIGPLMASHRPMDDEGVSVVGIYRRTGQEHFNERETRIAHIVLSEVPWLHYQSFPDRETHRISRLYPRHRAVMNLLCEGWSRKKIADHLNLSINTVHGYVKAIFEHFDVHSQAELITRFRQGDGGDTPDLGAGDPGETNHSEP